MKKLLLILLLIPVFTNSQLVSLIVRGDTLFSIDPLTGTERQITRTVPTQAGQSGKVLSTNGTAYTWYDLATVLNLKAPLASPIFTGVPVVPGYLQNTTTAGVAATPTASSTVTVTHGLGRAPTTIRIKAISSFTSNAAATPVPFSEGTYNSSGNRCLYMVINGTTTQVSQTSTSFSIIMVTSAGNQITGVIGNLTSTTFDIVFTETGTHTVGNYLWEAQ